MAKTTTAQRTTTSVVEFPGVVSRLEQARNEQMRFRLWLGLASFFLGAFGILSVFMLVDWMWVVPAGLRLLALPALAGFAVALVAQSQRPYDKPEAAADAETQFPELGQRVRTVLQYADPASKPVPASPGLLRALARQTDHLAAALDFRKLIPWPIFERRAIGVFLVSVIALVTLLASPSLRIAALRMLFFPAQYTTMQRRARRPDPQSRRAAQARSHSRRPAGQVGPVASSNEEWRRLGLASARAGARARRVREAARGPAQRDP